MHWQRPAVQLQMPVASPACRATAWFLVIQRYKSTTSQQMLTTSANGGADLLAIAAGRLRRNCSPALPKKSAGQRPGEVAGPCGWVQAEGIGIWRAGRGMRPDLLSLGRIIAANVPKGVWLGNAGRKCMSPWPFRRERNSRGRFAASSRLVTSSLRKGPGGIRFEHCACKERCSQSRNAVNPGTFADGVFPTPTGCKRSSCPAMGSFHEKIRGQEAPPAWAGPEAD
jgi:hypothetical protein